MRPIIIASVLSVALAACGGSASHMAQKNISCGCSDYMDAAPRPAWVDGGDIVTASYRQSHGTANCTGLKNIDFDAADLAARAKLSRMISAKTDIRISETRRDYGYGAGSAEARIDSSQISQVVLEGSRIEARWIDPESCLVYAAVRLPNASYEATKKRLAAQEKARLVNQRFYLNVQGAPEDQASLRAALAQSLSEAGVSRMVEKAEVADIEARIAIANLNVSDTSLNGQVSVSLYRDETNLWSRSFTAKAASFSAKPKNALLTRALENAMRGLKAPLSEILNK